MDPNASNRGWRAVTSGGFASKAANALKWLGKALGVLVLVCLTLGFVWLCMYPAMAVPRW